MRGATTVLGFLLAAAMLPAWAGTVYRCDGADGSRSYTSKRKPGASCTVVSSYKTEPYRAPVAAAPPAAGSLTSAPSVSTASVAAPAAASLPKRPKFLRMAVSTTYSYVDARGVRNYSNSRPRGVANVTAIRTEYPIFEMETCYACAAKPGVNFGRIKLNMDAYRSEIAAASRDFGVDEAIIRAIIHAESAYRPTALSRVGAQGLMQLMPATARRFGVSNAFDAGQNIRGGVQYLAWLLKRFKGDLTLAAAGYNAGEGAVDKYKGVPPYSETRRYVERVGTLAERYRGSLASR